MRMLMGLALMGGVLGTAAMMPDGNRAADTPATAASVHAWRLIGEGRTCLIGIAADRRGTQAIEKRGGCDALDPLGGPLFWRTRGDGGVEFADASGRAVVEFGPSDGAAWETFRAGQPMLTLVPAD